MDTIICKRRRTRFWKPLMLKFAPRSIWSGKLWRCFYFDAIYVVSKWPNETCFRQAVLIISSCNHKKNAKLYKEDECIKVGRFGARLLPQQPHTNEELTVEVVGKVPEEAPSQAWVDYWKTLLQSFNSPRDNWPVVNGEDPMKIGIDARATWLQRKQFRV